MQIAKMNAANQYLGTVFLWIHSGLFKKKCDILHFHVYFIKFLVVTHTTGMQHSNYAKHWIVFPLKNWHTLVLGYSGQRDARQSSLREGFDSQTQRGDRKCVLRTRGSSENWVACFAVDLWVCGCASEGGVLCYDQMWRDVDSQCGSVSAGATLHRLLVNYAPLQSSNTDPTMSPQRVSATSTMRYYCTYVPDCDRLSTATGYLFVTGWFLVKLIFNTYTYLCNCYSLVIYYLCFFCICILYFCICIFTSNTFKSNKLFCSSNPFLFL